MLLILPDFILNTSLAKVIKQYDYFDYTTNGDLFLSEQENNTITGIIELIEKEYHANFDDFFQCLVNGNSSGLKNFKSHFPLWKIVVIIHGLFTPKYY
jgi:AraC family transcriptional activator of pobA